MQRLRRSNAAGNNPAPSHHTRPASSLRAVRPRQPGLLVSVRDLDEGRMAAAANVTIIDLKDPRRGALGSADPLLWRAFADEFAEHSLSAAMGEWDEAMQVAGEVPPEFRFAKAGPVGAQDQHELINGWKAIKSRLPQSVELVAVAYADHEQAATLSAENIFSAAQEAGLNSWLLDTFVKDRRSSIEHLGKQRLQSLLRFAETKGAHFALAGSVTWTMAKQCVADNCLPAWFAIRGDVCDEGRNGRLSEAKLTQWCDWLASL